MGFVQDMKDEYQEAMNPSSPKVNTELDYLQSIANDADRIARNVGTLTTLVVLSLILSVIGGCVSFLNGY